MASSVTVKSLGKIGKRYFLRFSDGIEYEFSSIQEITDWAKHSDVDRTLLHQIIVRKFIVKGGTLATAQKDLVGKTLTLDLTLDSILRVS
jgi:hypothetical protein